VGVVLVAAPRAWAAEEAADGTQSVLQTPEEVIEELELQIPQSVFVARKEAGVRDPFFPESQRRWDSEDTEQTPIALPITEKIQQFVFLRGITGQEGDKVALLNNQTFKAGDTVKLKLRDGTLITVTVAKILETSVEFTVEGQAETFVKQLE